MSEDPLGNRRVLNMRCQFHKEERASCWLHRDGTWWCFGCSTGGTWEFGLGGYTLTRNREPGEDDGEEEGQVEN